MKDKFSRLPFGVRSGILVLLAVVCGCGGFYIWFNYQYIRADFVAARATGHVEYIYDDIHNLTPSGAGMISEEKPQSGSFDYGLSDDAERYAYVGAQQTYSFAGAFADIIAGYTDGFAKRGWIVLPLSSYAGQVKAAFQHPGEEGLIIGLCTPIKTVIPQQYTVFFVFRESHVCEARSRLDCYAAQYCE